MMRGVIDVNDEQLERMVDKIARCRRADPSGDLVRRHDRCARAHVQGRHRRPSRVAGARRSSPSCAGPARESSPSTRPPSASSSPHQASTLDGIELVADPLAVAVGADVIVVFTEWPEFAKIDLAALAAIAGPGTPIVDTRNLLDPVLVREAGFEYDGVGRR